MYNFNGFYPSAQYYPNVLSKDEILTIGRIVKNFYLNNISYSSLVEQINSLNILVSPVVIDVNSYDIADEEKSKTKERYTNNEYYGNDIEYFILSTTKHSKIIFLIDDFLIETLAMDGDIDAQATLRNNLVKELDDFTSSHKFHGKKAKKIIKEYLDKIEYLDNELNKSRTQ